MSKVRWPHLVWGLAAVVLMASCVVIWASNRFPSPDPHGERLRRLKAVAATLPSSFAVVSLQAREPARSTCDGDVGWDSVYVRVVFTSGKRSFAQVTSALQQLFAQAGWHLDRAVEDDQLFHRWSSNSPRGALAMLLVDPRSPSPHRWTLTLTAAPRGHEIGC